MPGTAAVVVPDCPHYVTQAGNRPQAIFSGDADYRRYYALLREFCDLAGTAVLSYCLMPDQVHLVMIPSESDGLNAPLEEVRRRCTPPAHFREGQRKGLWEREVHYFVLDWPYLGSAIRCVEANPVRAHLCAEPVDWPWSSARARLEGVRDPLVNRLLLKSLLPRGIAGCGNPADDEIIRGHTRTGRPLGDGKFMARLERLTGRNLGSREPAAGFAIS